MANNKKDIVKILSIDGGGVRGLIPCIFLNHLRNELDSFGNKTPFYDLFDVISGTSTGSLISLMLIKPPEDYTDRERLDLLLDLYENKTKKIFPEAKCEICQTIKHFFRPKYNGKTLRRLLRQNFKNLTLEDSLSNLIIPTYDMISMRPYLFKYRTDVRDYYHNFFLKDVGLSSSAAPTYLPPANVKTITTGESYCFVDGGIFCNNPSLCAYTYAKKLYPHAKQYIIVSLGTGEYVRTYECKKVKKWGVLGWMNPISGIPLLTAYMDSQMESDNYIINSMDDVKEYRFEISLNGISSELDDSSERNIDFLKGKAAELILLNRHKINQLVKLLNI
ncbi:patatin-like phospholipase family protein [Vallitalea sp.]|jgi:patatin-like phospholipase/acyl hydrolase|uniref:patatin-like phospholipase family protein n=1 Tax=Vallitalea sp. TaxID=1882829 RepID=UPI0025F17299|nr:patatin-like phospholipase family protein [Vallitalea sp.]MCT4685948.1 patatin-like phospholipase family protein [Vallitalea sp.]